MRPNQQPPSLEPSADVAVVVSKKANTRRQNVSQLVDAATGKPTTLTGDALSKAKAAKQVISKGAYTMRQLVDAASGKSTTLTGDALSKAKAAKQVISKAAYARSQWVDATTGEPTMLTGDALTAAQAAKQVISKSAYTGRQLVDAATGKPTTLTGDALSKAKAAKQVISKTAYAQRQWVDAATGKPTTLTGDALLAAKAAKQVITKGIFYSRSHREHATGKARHAATSVIDSEDWVDVAPVGGIAAKYLTGRVTRLPRLSLPTHLSSPVLSQFSAHLDFLPLQGCLPCGDDALSEPHLLSLSTTEGAQAEVKMVLMTQRPQITAHDKPIFIFAGRKERAFIPRIESRGLSDVRVILVAPHTDVDELKGFVQPGVDVLLLEQLRSPTHGDYEQLGLINSRRIGAFYCAMLLKERYNIAYALMADDNLSAVHFNLDAGKEATWSVFFDAITRELQQEQSVCVSLSTISN